MPKKLLIANRGEIAIRVARTASELRIKTVAVYSPDDGKSLHIQHCDDAFELPGAGVSAYLNIQSLIDIALKAGCDALHPGYGLLSESAELSKACADNGIVFVGPSVTTLQSFGDKISARALARSADISVIEGTDQVNFVADIKAFFKSQNQSPIMIKAVNGGGGRGMRVVARADEIDSAFTRCQAESLSAFGSDELYVERFLPTVRHIEVQIVGDGTDVIHLWERDCTIQRRNQKMIELAPAPNLDPTVRQQLLDAAITLGKACAYKGLGTVEFLLEVDQQGNAGEFFFIETNPRIQVEHTVTEEVTGLDLVSIQLRIAGGETLADLGLLQEAIALPNGFALQARITTETVNDQGELVPTGGTLQQFQLPGGPGIRIDTYAYAGYSTNPHFDSLLAKLIVHSKRDDGSDNDLRQLLSKAERALSETCISGIDTNIDFLRRLLKLPDLQTWQVSVRGVEAQLPGLMSTATTEIKKRFVTAKSSPAIECSEVIKTGTDYPEGTLPVNAPLQSVLVSLEVAVGQTVQAGDELAVVEAMKMQHAVKAPSAAVIVELLASPGITLSHGQALLLLRPEAGAEQAVDKIEEQDVSAIRPDLKALQERLAITLDKARPEAVDKLHRRGQRTARENITDLCDPDTFIEYGQLVYAAQRSRTDPTQLQQDTPADGIVAGFASVNGHQFNGPHNRAAILSYDAMVMAGTQGTHGHKKTDRILEVAAELALPLVFFSGGGGGRPGDDDVMNVVSSALDIKTFYTLAKMQGKGPKIAVNSGYCFAGNAVVFGSCDLKIATRNSWIGLGGPAMIEGGGLGACGPKDIGPASEQAKTGLIDILVENDREAVAATQHLLSFFQGKAQDWDAPDQRLLRHIIPEDPKRVYEMRLLIESLADTHSWLELRREFGLGMVTGLLRVEGRPIGIIANNPMHLGGAIDAQAAEKAAGFIRLCERFRLPILSLCDTPGFMVGPDSETQGAVRHACDFVSAGARTTVPYLVVCVRKGFGLGAQGMAGGSFSASQFTIAWPTGQFGPMGIEGGVRLGYKKELDAETDPQKRDALFNQLVARATDMGSAASVASLMELDAVIDPVDTRHWIVQSLAMVG